MNKKTTSPNSYLLNEPNYRAHDGRPKLLRIIFTAAYTKVDFGYQTTDYYIRGGWIKIAPQTFIRIQKSNEKFSMLKAEHIPLAPNHFHFNTSKDWLFYSLYFEPMPIKKCLIDIIEAEPGTNNDFNYQEVNIDPKKMIALF